MYFATKGRSIKTAYTNTEMQSYLDNGWTVVYRDDDRHETVIGENGAWIGEKPDIEAEQKAVKQFNEQVRQNTADLAYISMMTGVDL